MNDSQNLGLGELGQRVQAMSDPAPDSRLRPYQGAPVQGVPMQGGQVQAVPVVPSHTANGRNAPSLEPYEDLRSSPPAAPTPYTPLPYQQPTAPSSTSPSPIPGSAQERLSPWESVPPPRQVPQPPLSPPPDQPPPSGLPSGAPAAATTSDAPKSGLQRAIDAIRSTIPLVQKLLPLIDGNFATAVSALVAPHMHPAPPPQPQVVHVDMEPVERGLAEVRNSHRELRTQVMEQVSSLKRVEDQLDRVREATDRNTLEQQELVEDLRSVGSRVSTFAIVGLVLLLVSLGLNVYLIVELQHILR